MKATGDKKLLSQSPAVILENREVSVRQKTVPYIHTL
jgi:hypothetical protein